MSPPEAHCCGPCPDCPLPFPPASTSGPDSGSCGPDVCPGALVGFRLDLSAELVQRAWSWAMECAEARLFLTRRQEGPSHLPGPSPFIQDLEQNLPRRAFHYKLEKGKRRREVSSRRRSACKSVRRRRLRPLPHPATVLREQTPTPRHSRVFAGTGPPEPRAVNRAMTVLFPRLPCALLTQ